MRGVHSRWSGVEPKSKLHPQPITGNASLHPFTIAKGKGRMDWDDYLRDQSARYRHLAEAAEDPLIKQEHFELASICEEVANHIEDRRTGG